jgi:Tfp pilus assembly protein PilF
LHYWKGLGLEAMGNVEGARKELQQALSKRPSYTEAAAALARIGE